jgi:hypothetical protein
MHILYFYIPEVYYSVHKSPGFDFKRVKREAAVLACCAGTTFDTYHCVAGNATESDTQDACAHDTRWQLPTRVRTRFQQQLSLQRARLHACATADHCVCVRAALVMRARGLLSRVGFHHNRCQTTQIPTSPECRSVQHRRHSTQLRTASCSKNQDVTAIMLVQ